jgi:hypothetical protein
MKTLLTFLSVVCLAAPALAQTRGTGRLAVTVTDPSGAVIPTATVVVTPQEPAGPALAPVAASMEGQAVIDGLAAGRYTVAASFEGFETVTVRDVRVRNGETKSQKVSLPLKKIDEAVTVGRDKQTAALDPLGNSFSTVLTREQIEALPDDPDEMEAALKAMSPPGATLRVDGFTGGKLPPKSQIRSIRLPRMDMMAAQNHGGLNGAMFIDIMTQPGLGSFRGSVDSTFRDDALNAKNPFTPTKGDEALRQGGLSLSGPIQANRSSYSITFNGGSDYTTSNILAETLDGTIAAPVRMPSTRTSLNVRLDTAISQDHAMRWSYARNESTRKNMGVGAFTLPSAGFTQRGTDQTFRVSENGPVGKRFFSESRLQLRWSETRATSATEAATIRVNDAFTTGGAQQSGGDHNVEFEAATDLDYVRGKHSMRTGILFEGGRYRSDASTNYLGTYTFASLADYAAGRPSNYTRRIGDPNVRFDNFQMGVYAQDDWRVHKTTMLSLGVRYEAQTLLADQQNFSPRASVTWSPFKDGKTTFRAGLGYFNDWLGTSTYEQTLRVDGERQREINLRFPSYPDPGDDLGVTLPVNKYLLASGLTLPNSWNGNVGVERQFGSALRMNASYTYRRGAGLMRGANLNAPVDGVRPDPAFANIVAVTGDGASRSHMLNIGANILALNWHRTIFFVNYGYARSEANTSGAFALPANGNDLSTEWGPAQPRHRFQGQFNIAFGNLGVSLNARAMSGSPYNITTGRDDNADGVFNDRPTGVGRNSAWTRGQWDIGGRLNYAIGFGTRPPAAGGGGGMMIVIGGGGGGPQGGFGGGAANARYQLNFYLAASNLTNHDNFIGYSGVLTSPFFGQPTNVLNPRKLELGVRFGF